MPTKEEYEANKAAKKAKIGETPAVTNASDNDPDSFTNPAVVAARTAEAKEEAEKLQEQHLEGVEPVVSVSAIGSGVDTPSPRRVHDQGGGFDTPETKAQQQGAPDPAKDGDINDSTDNAGYRVNDGVSRVTKEDQIPSREDPHLPKVEINTDGNSGKPTVEIPADDIQNDNASEEVENKIVLNVDSASVLTPGVTIVDDENDTLKDWNQRRNMDNPGPVVGFRPKILGLGQEVDTLDAEADVTVVRKGVAHSPS